MVTDLEIEFHLKELMPQLQNKVDSHFQENYIREPIIVGKTFLQQRNSRKLTLKEGRKYYKIILEEGGEWGGFIAHVFGFIRKGDGAILKAASWSKPETRTKSAIRGYITDEEAIDYFDYHGVVYAL